MPTPPLSPLISIPTVSIFPELKKILFTYAGISRRELQNITLDNRNVMSIRSKTDIMPYKL